MPTALMSNHFHLVAETPAANLVTGMKWFLGTYTIRFNARHRLRGHLFAGRYKSLLINETDPHYLRVACDYVHLNPARANLMEPAQRLETYRWSSYGAYLEPSLRPGWLRTDRIFGEHGLGTDSRVTRLDFARRMESERVRVNDPEAGEPLLGRNWRLGGETFLARVLDQMERKVTPSHGAAERADVAERKAERIIREIGWSESDLRKSRKGAPEKVEIAKRLRGETTLSLKQVANRLSLGT